MVFPSACLNSCPAGAGPAPDTPGRRVAEPGGIKSNGATERAGRLVNELRVALRSG